ncbi:leucine-rich repeat domain-containing protein [Paenibacillus pedocola]|uniref:leucine-rich repeat domain-containing protein n=1 Tax=Paenibacillus pedocola TaxID=3242193 RepID=UPI002877C2E8|nr:leucine-rich repeat domain-containing protein [Paenibacillus typhae]
MSTRLSKRFISFSLVVLLLPATAVWAASVITDPVLAKAIRTELKLPAKKELKAADLQKLKSLYPQESSSKITSVQGLEYAVNLQSLFLPNQKIKSIRPLSKLKKLTFLALEGNQLTDLSPVAGLNSLTTLTLEGNQIKSLVPLKNLNKLTSLLASKNQVEDLNPVQNLKLEWLFLGGNKI